MDVCTWFSIEERDLVGSSSSGTLFNARIKRWESLHPEGYDRPAPRKGGEEGVGYFFCSKTRPAVIFKTEDGSWMVHNMVPGSGPTGGASESALILYFAACHGRVPTTEEDYPELADTFGYPTNADLGEGWGSGPIANPTDVLRKPHPPVTASELSEPETPALPGGGKPGGTARQIVPSQPANSGVSGDSALLETLGGVALGPGNPGEAPIVLADPFLGPLPFPPGDVNAGSGIPGSSARQRSADEVLTRTAGPGCSMHDATFTNWQSGSVRFVLDERTSPYAALRLTGTFKTRDGSEHAFSDLRFYRIFALNCVRPDSPCQYLHPVPHPTDDLPDGLGDHGLWTAGDGGSWWSNPRAPAPSWIRIDDDVFTRECPSKSSFAFDTMLDGFENGCVESPALETFRRSVARMAPDGKWEPTKPILPGRLGELVGWPVVRAWEEFSTISLAANGTYRGLRVGGFEFDHGHDNGIAAFRVLFDASVSDVTQALGPSWTTEGTTVNPPDGGARTYYGLHLRDGAVLAYCDWST